MVYYRLKLQCSVFHYKQYQHYYDYPEVVATDDCKGSVVVTFAALVVDDVLVDEVAAVVPHCELVAVLGFDAVAAYAVDVRNSHVVVAVLSPVGGIEVHADVILLLLPVLQEVLTELLYLTDQL